MRALHSVALLAAIVAFPASADEYVFRTKDVVVRLQEAACPAKVAQFIRDDAVPKFRVAAVVHQGRELLACWTLENGTVLLVDEEGDAGTLPASAFRVEKGV